MVAPVGTVHLYDVAFVTATMEYVRESPGQTFASPPVTVIVPGVAGAVVQVCAETVCAVMKRKNKMTGKFIFMQ